MNWYIVGSYAVTALCIAVEVYLLVRRSRETQA